MLIRHKKITNELLCSSYNFGVVMSRKGVRFGAVLPWLTPVDQILDIARASEETGFSSIWTGDHLLHFPGRTVPEGWTILTAAGMVTNKVFLGTCVTDPHRYHPAVLAQRLATIDQFSNGRVILGLGAGDAINLEPFQIEWNKPVSRLVEAVKVMRRLWAGEKFNYEGKFWKFRDAFLQIKPVKSKVPIYFAAMRPRMLRLTGEMADGWLPLALTPKMYRKRLKLIEEAARKAGRTPDDIEAGLYVITSVADKAEDAYKQIDRVKPVLVPETLREAGYEVEFPNEFRSYSYLDWMPTSEYVEYLARYGKFVPKEAAIEFCISGTAQDCVDKIDEFVKAGVKHFILHDVGADQHKVRELYRKEIIPRFVE